ncbi:Zn-ribbon domain-containing OB-fold protein [Streptomyces spiralis]|uniref:Zn-ribbon domain-containing OB-fold protein n=1 Tax=Streptomyces spiralis TaxID=66376 RepID=UPI0033CA5A07
MDSRTIPHVLALTAPYWEAARDRRLCLQRCAVCGLYVHFPQLECPRCANTELPYEQVSGRGVVHTFSIVHRTFAPGFAARVPYVIAWIELVEQAGLRVFGNVLHCPPEQVCIGMPVELCFEDLDGFGPIPNFRAVPEEALNAPLPVAGRRTP